MVKGGSTVPLKFEVFAGDTELTSTDAITGLRVLTTTCASDAVEDDVEVTSAGRTALAYDATEGWFQYNWKTPRTAGPCLTVVVTTADGSEARALFRIS